MALDIYIIRIYRRDESEPGMIVGIVVDIGTDLKQRFSSFEELNMSPICNLPFVIICTRKNICSFLYLVSHLGRGSRPTVYLTWNEGVRYGKVEREYMQKDADHL